MSMYLPNTAVRPAESDPVEFLEIPPRAHEGDGETSTSVYAQQRPTLQLSHQARVDLTRRARDYITHLVANYGGDSEDVRWVIHDLQDQIAVTDHRRVR